MFETWPPSYNVCSIPRLCRALSLLVSIKTLSNLAGFRDAPFSSADGSVFKMKNTFEGSNLLPNYSFSAAIFVPVVRQSSEKQRGSL